MLSINLLGPPEVSIEEGHTTRFGIKKSLALLGYLAAEGSRPPRKELTELLWPQSKERRARTIAGAWNVYSRSGSPHRRGS
jgi:DNA-binding SARP family transcriptional activator